ncbi:MAG: alpha-amylase family glycosyl hydrolase [Aquidulcibacter sp.]|uniref:alpha-amylase family glycosyl hydrolase n=1 Tax=Aquidulcibacter sp. TaxID=2052990 RepID=UPI0022C2F8C9|nr:alpha-amylase family glycosyl hydrolase [Aquidulcibacter sp.]MCZ8208351.1 alpha-amylase family glycosyl hydrolase [Aquidulcibacter sp.]
MTPRSRLKGLSLAALTWSCVAGSGASAQTTGPLHVPSPDWRDQVIYFVMTDRFEDGDPSNNNQGKGEFDPAQRGRFSGGDLKGVEKRLDYIQGLGATSVWVTPPVENQWLDPATGYGGYHGYWASNLKAIDRHLGSLKDYQSLSRALHGKGMYLIQDIVLNHTGNFFNYGSEFDPKDPTKGYVPYPNSVPMAAPTQYPFSLNDPRSKADREAGIYHWTPDIKNLSERDQELNYQLSGLDDLNTENPVVKRALRDSYAHWIKEAGVDGFRVDTIFYVPPELMTDFMYSKDPKAPGIAEIARRTGRENFHVFGEGFGMDRRFEDKVARRVNSYMVGPQGEARSPGMINFPLYGTATDVFARGRPPAELAYRIENMMALHQRPHLMPTFLDNHDVDRFLSGGTETGLRQNLLLMMTLPGIPVIYYGTEQGFTVQRAAMFANGWGSGGRDHFDTTSPLYRYIASLTKLRRENRVLSRGAPKVLAGEAAGAGALVYLMQDGGETLLVAMNTADHPVLLDNLELGQAAGTVLQPLFAMDGKAPLLVVGQNKRLTTELGAQTGAVWRVTKAPPLSLKAAASGLRLDPLPSGPITEPTLKVSGQASPGEMVKLVLDGNLGDAQAIQADATGRWQAKISTAAFVDETITHRVTAYSAKSGQATEAGTFKVRPSWSLRNDITDPADDDTGPPGSAYAYPTDPSFEPPTMDFEGVRLSTAGGAVKLELGMGAISQVWGPQNGFDHLSLTGFIQLPGQSDTGARVMPNQRGDLPEGMRWHYRFRAHGWTNALFSHVGASATQEGTKTGPAPSISVDKEAKRITLIFPSSSFGDQADLTGAKLYLTTWDYDAAYRALEPTAGAYIFGGAKSSSDPKVMDAIGPFSIGAAPSK